MAIVVKNPTDEVLYVVTEKGSYSIEPRTRTVIELIESESVIRSKSPQLEIKTIASNIGKERLN